MSDTNEVMNNINVTEETAPALSADEKMIQDGFNELLDAYMKSNHRMKVDRIKKAFDFK